MVLISDLEAIDNIYQESVGKTKTRANISNIKVDEVGIITKGFTIYSK